MAVATAGAVGAAGAAEAAMVALEATEAMVDAKAEERGMEETAGSMR